jgi:hypothetical protein
MHIDTYIHIYVYKEGNNDIDVYIHIRMRTYKHSPDEVP